MWLVKNSQTALFQCSIFTLGQKKYLTYSPEYQKLILLVAQIDYLLQQLPPVWPYFAIYWTLGNLLKPLATINLPKSLTFLGNFCVVVKIYHFSSEIVFGQLL